MALDIAKPTVWDDPSRPVAERVSDLVSRLSLAEKAAQLSGVWIGVGRTDAEVAPQQHELAALPRPWAELVRDGLGQLTRPFGSAPVDPVEGAREIAATQRTVMASGRWGLPALVHEECLTGLAAWQASLYPSPLCWGASFDPVLVEQMAAQIGRTMRRLGVHQGLAPVLDVTRDLRWGRVEETIGEDPYLVGSIGSAYVRGLQSQGRIATLKHFVGYSASRGGRNLAPVSIGGREIADVLLPPFEMALRAGAGSVMNSYTDLDGVPVASDAGLLTDLLRGDLGFSGTVVADYFAVSFLQTLHGVAADAGEAAGLALHAGIDVELPSVSCYGAPLVEAVEAGRVDVALVDRALERVLRQKCELGLLDPDWSPDAPLLAEESAEGEQDVAPLDGPDHRELAAALARRSVVLLHNTGALPLRPATRLAVVGPRADDPGAMMGCYSFPLHVGVHHPEVDLGIEVSSVLDALRADPSGFAVDFAPGCPVIGGDDAGIEQAAQLAAGADVCVAVLGDQAGLFGRGTSGEGCDVADLRLPGRQEELLEAVLDTGTPVVLVLLVGRPYELGRQVDRLAAVVCGFYPGEEGAGALADVLAGRVEPAGRLPVGFPGGGAGQPAPYLSAALGRRSDVSSLDPSPLFPFGHGLSYHPPTWRSVTPDMQGAPPQTWPTSGTFRVVVTVANPHDRPISEVVQVYLHDPVAEVARPDQLLVAAPRVDLAPGEARAVTIELHGDQASYTGRDGLRRVDPGDVELRVGPSSAQVVGRLHVEMTGPARCVGRDRVLEPLVCSVVVP